MRCYSVRASGQLPRRPHRLAANPSGRQPNPAQLTLCPAYPGANRHPPLCLPPGCGTRSDYSFYPGHQPQQYSVPYEVLPAESSLDTLLAACSADGSRCSAAAFPEGLLRSEMPLATVAYASSSSTTTNSNSSTCNGTYVRMPDPFMEETGGSAHVLLARNLRYNLHTAIR